VNIRSKLPITMLAVMLVVSACQTNNNYADDDTELVVAQVQQPKPSPTAKLEMKLAKLEAILAKLEATISRQTEQKSVVVVNPAPAPVVISKPKATPVPPLVVTAMKPKLAGQPVVVSAMKPKLVIVAKPKPKPVPKPVVIATVEPKLVGQPKKVAKQRIQILSLDIFSLVSDTTLSKQARKSKFSKLLVNYLNIPEIGRLVMDTKYWDNTNETQRASYLKAFNNYVLNIFSSKFDGFDGKANPVKGFTIKNVVVVGKKKDILVRSKISTDTNLYHVDWRLRKDNGTFKIIDLSTKGISLVLTLRGDFGGVLNSKGVNGLINVLNNRKV
jgi:phospholipid transport system substrate-binding protein